MAAVPAATSAVVLAAVIFVCFWCGEIPVFCFFYEYTPPLYCEYWVYMRYSSLASRFSCGFPFDFWGTLYSTILRSILIVIRTYAPWMQITTPLRCIRIVWPKYQYANDTNLHFGTEWRVFDHIWFWWLLLFPRNKSEISTWASALRSEALVETQLLCKMCVMLRSRTPRCTGDIYILSMWPHAGYTIYRVVEVGGSPGCSHFYDAFRWAGKLPVYI